MNVIIALSIVNIALQTGAVITAFTIARAPGWRRVRVMGLIALTAVAYSVVRLIGEVATPREAFSPMLTSTNLVVGALHLSGWLWYTTADDTGAWRSLPAWARRVAYGVVGSIAAGSGLGLMLVPGVLVSVDVPWLGVSFVHPILSPVGIVAAALLVAMLVIVLREQAVLARRGVPGARAIVAGFAVFAACGLEELVVAAGWLDFIYLGELGYLALIVPVTLQLLRRFTEDARQLAQLSERLSAEVQTVEGERDIARDEFLAQERFAALGRIASGVGHEINNPLQYLTLNLEELRDRHLASEAGEAAEALEQSFHAAERIRRIVDGMRAYARTTVPHFAPLDPRELVRTALRETTVRLDPLPAVREGLEAVPLVMGDPEKLVQAIGNAVTNSAIALERSAGRAPTIEVRTFTAPSGDAAIEVRDNGPGFPNDLLPRLGEPFVTTRATVGGSGLGLFVVRGIVHAHGGTLQLENVRGGGALLRILLPPAPQAT
ncbi:MAG: hypothetical protein JNL44_04380 [Gemmatimonadetes bacterium]|nr:hypothetical protein [Gemmatimonadota bacterium]